MLEIALKLAVTTLAIAIFAARAEAGSYYASPTGGGDGRSASTPSTVSQFWPIAAPGDTLVLLDGRYTGSESMIGPPEGLSGIAGQPITIRAANDGQVEIDGEERYVPVRLVRNDWYVVEGLNAHHGSKEVVALFYSNHNIVRRVCAWQAADHNNGNCFAAHYGEHNLFEDCAGWGRSRKVFTNSQGGNHTTYRRCWGRWEGCHIVGPKMTYSLFYNSHHILAENCIGTWDARQMRESHVVLRTDGQGPYVSDKGAERYYQPLTLRDFEVDQPYGIFSMDANRGLLPDQSTSGPSMYGCIAYTLPGQAIDHLIGLFFIRSTRPDDGYLENCLGYGSPDSKGTVQRIYNLTNCRGRSLTAVGESERSSNTPGISAFLESPNGTELVTRHEHLLKVPGGADITHRYENGVLTDQPLWPWPMNQRIIDAMELAGYEPVDVTATVYGLAGGMTP